MSLLSGTLLTPLEVSLVSTSVNIQWYAQELDMVIDLSCKTCTSGFLLFGVNYQFRYLTPIWSYISLRLMWLKFHTNRSKTQIKTRLKKKGSRKLVMLCGEVELLSTLVHRKQRRISLCAVSHCLREACASNAHLDRVVVSACNSLK